MLVRIEIIHVRTNFFCLEEKFAPSYQYMLENIPFFCSNWKNINSNGKKLWEKLAVFGFSRSNLLKFSSNWNAHIINPILSLHFHSDWRLRKGERAWQRLWESVVERESLKALREKRFLREKGEGQEVSCVFLYFSFRFSFTNIYRVFAFICWDRTTV